MISKHLFVCTLVFFVNLYCIPVSSETYKSVIWDPNNPSFIVNSDCPYNYKLLKIRSSSKIQFICPNVATVLQTTEAEVSKTNKYENLWLLYNKESFDKCDTRIDPNVARPVLRCIEPTQLRFHSITFLRFAAIPDEPEFKKGHSYYIIATSDGKYSNINATSGGHCNDTAKNVSMKIEVYVCNNTEDVRCKDGVGELICPGESSPSSTPSTQALSTPHVTSSTPSEATSTQVSTPTTGRTSSTALATETEKPTGIDNNTSNKTAIQEGQLGNRETQKGDSTGDSETVWMVTACIFIVVCVVFAIAIMWYFFFGGKKKACQYESSKVTPTHPFGRKNPAFKHDTIQRDNDGFTEPETKSLPDKENGVVIYNKEVFYDKVDESVYENPPV